MQLTKRELAKGWHMETRATVQCAVMPDGLLVVFDRAETEAAIDSFYPHRIRSGEKVWFFNSSLDREIAEIDGDRIIANPRVLWEHYMREG